MRRASILSLRCCCRCRAGRNRVRRVAALSVVHGSPVAQVITVVGNSPVLWKALARNSLRGLRMPGSRKSCSRTCSSGSQARRLLVEDGSAGRFVITGSNDRGVLYGAFALLRKIALGESIAKLDEKQRAARSGPLGESLGQPGWHDRARLRRPIDLLGQRHARADLTPRRRLRPHAGVARHQRLLDQ